ncbi:MAG: glycerol-3-phosphate dehydrogenase/oxidase [Rhodovulum sulfidophilum]|uniref:Glycerol-3-phosphate dehydrogenase/oxidase n=1 Tax=Rhodovulum sulfidophilum TaxID=35806 RepID=A0A2W5NB33_RHOSU|nr:MAG: glycerol-3-phosphate dehydrogenase/oxidase [Rhodovulum sulfidophilum]
MPTPASTAFGGARHAALTKLASLSTPDVLILGGGVNGVGTLRDLALNGVSAVLIDVADFAGGASGASSRMAHGGLRYLEGREFRLVAEATRERNLLLRDAGHLVRPLEIVVPLEHLTRGLGGSVARFLGLSDRAGPLSLAALAGALGLYELLGRVRRALPGPRITLSRRRFPAGLDDGARAVASYYDGQITQPEGLILEMLGEATGHPGVAAINHVAWRKLEDGAFLVTDPLSGAALTLRPRLVVNATGAAIDAANAALGLETRLVRGVKGAHLVLRHPELRARMNGRAFYFGDGQGRMVICLPVGDCVLMGTTEVEVTDPGDHSVAEAEVGYLIGAIGRLFPDLRVGREHIAALTSGIRPLQASDGNATQAARDHALVELRAGSLPVLALVGGKWTTFRSFSEQATDRALAILDRARTTSTADRAYPGAADVDRAALAAETGLSEDRIAVLVQRYGAVARQVAAHCAARPDQALRRAPGFSRREIGWLVDTRMTLSLEDLVLRRTGLALGDAPMTRALLAELAAIMAETLGRDAAWQEEQVAACLGEPRIAFVAPIAEVA